MTAQQPSIIISKRQRTKHLVKLAAKSFYLHLRGRNNEMYNLICNEFMALGGIYIKFLQGVLFNTEIMRSWNSPNKFKIFENVVEDDLNIIAILQQELSAEELRNIVAVSPTPFAAGSFGQVYLARHANGKQIIIKALRPNVTDMLRYDLKLLGIFSKQLVAQQYEHITVEMDEVFKAFKTSTLSETDYVSEAQFAHELYEAYASNPHILIPKTYLELCTSRLIIQEYVGGISGAELLKIKEQGIDPATYVREQLGSDLEKQLELLGIDFMMSAFALPRVQGDPHPGNIRFLPHNQVGIIDFGIWAPTPHNKAAFYGIVKQWDLLYHDTNLPALFEGFIRFFANDLYRALKRLSNFRPQARQHAFRDTDLVQEMCQTVYGMVGTTFSSEEVREIAKGGQVLQTLGEKMNQGNKLGLIIKIEAVEMLRAWRTYMSMTSELGLSRTVFPAVFAEASVRIAAEYPQAVYASEKPITITRAVDIISCWLERVAVRDPATFQQMLWLFNEAKPQ